MFIVMFSSPSKYLVFRKKKKQVDRFRSVRSLRGSFHWYCFCRTWQPCNWTDYIYIYTRSCPSEQCENKSEFHEMESDTTNHMYIIWYSIKYLSTHLNSSIIKNIGQLSAPKKITSGHIFWNQMSRTICLGWRLAPPTQPPMSAAPLRFIPQGRA